jgi:hypothetical protein
VNPGNENVTVYIPGESSVTRYWPEPSVTAVRTFSSTTLLAASTVTPGNTAPELSRRPCEGRLRMGQGGHECHTDEHAERVRKRAPVSTRARRPPGCLAFIRVLRCVTSTSRRNVGTPSSPAQACDGRAGNCVSEWALRRSGCPGIRDFRGRGSCRIGAYKLRGDRLTSVTE